MEQFPHPSEKPEDLREVELFITDKCMGLVDAVEEHFPSSYWQRCIVHFYRNVFLSCPLSPDAGSFCDAQGHTF